MSSPKSNPQVAITPFIRETRLRGTLVAVDAAGCEAAAEGVEPELAVELDMPVRDEIERLAFSTETVGLETVDHRGEVGEYPAPSCYALYAEREFEE